MRLAGNLQGRARLVAMADPITPEVRRYVIERVDSVPELEILILLRSTADRTWTAQAVAERVYVSTALALALLEKLRAQGLLSVASAAGAGQYRFAPESAAESQMIDKLAEAYRSALIPLTQLIHSKPKASLVHFAEAFRMGKEGK